MREAIVSFRGLWWFVVLGSGLLKVEGLGLFGFRYT